MREGAESRVVHLLLVEDDPLQGAITRAVLAAIDGCEIRCCETAAETLAAAPSFDPQVILVDRNLPDLDGIELIGRLLGLFALSPPLVLLMTAGLDPGVHRRAIAAGAMGIITKPYDGGALVAEIVSGWRRHAAARRATGG